MLKFKLKELIAQKEFEEKRLVSVAEICSKTGIGRTTLSAILNNKGKNVGVDNVDKLCEFFDCEIQEILEYINEK
ncbi:helix-turn-helix domain-containing protein [Glaciecola sp. 1036]|uniref:helix-turn-helix domain-containing protein n=1 Tax=Alteromonadaceae TaxID=72275 RepID=UPI003D04CF5C